jgi:hypothetical protein
MSEDSNKLRRRHLRFGWYALSVFLILGGGLELLHGFKIGYYLDVENETRRLMWRLAHAHGALLALVNIAFALSLHSLQPGADLKLISACFIVAAILLPAGFFAGGVFARSGDPGLMILLVPVGALLLLYAVLGVARRS